jgi:hypothetical protein
VITVRRSLLGGALLLATLAGCGKAVPDSVAADYAAREAVSSHLVNASTVPITYSVAGHADQELVLQPGASFTGPGGAWATPQGWRCTWRGAGGTGVATTGSDAFESWMTFGGDNETVVACSRPTP